jgi:hypothetical protein
MRAKQARTESQDFASDPRMRSLPGDLGGHVDRTTVDMERSPVKPFCLWGLPQPWNPVGYPGIAREKALD